jgi:Leucine-rich repeat (LRR) protein
MTARLTAVAMLLPLAALAAGEREIATWAIRAGGRVLINEARTPVRDLSALPAGEFQITGLDLYGTIIEPKELEKISQLTTLKELYLPGPSWNPGAGSRLDANEELKFLAGLVNLEKLHFSTHFLTNVNVKDTGFEHLKTLTNLKELRLSQGRLQKFSLAPFANLESLDLSYSTASDEMMKSLAGLKKLRRINLRDSLVTDEGLRSLKGLSALEELDLYGLKITDAGVAQLADLQSLRKLNLLGGPVTDAGVEQLARLPKLMELNLYRSEMTNAGL